MDEKEKSAVFALLSVSANKPTGEMERMMGVVCRFVGSKRSETERYVISNCPIMKRNEIRRANDAD